MNATKQITHHDGSVSTSIINTDTNPIGHCCEHSWGCDPEVGYVELHPRKGVTVQLIVDQRNGTIYLNGFWKSILRDAINATTFHF